MLASGHLARHDFDMPDMVQSIVVLGGGSRNVNEREPK